MAHRRSRPPVVRTAALAGLAVACLALLATLAGGVTARSTGPAASSAASALPGAPTQPPDGSPWWHRDPDGMIRIDLWFGYSSTCPHCQAAMPWVTATAADLPWLDVHAMRVDGSSAQIQANIAQLLALASRIGEQIDGVPAFLYGARLRTGFADAATTGAAMRSELEAYHAEVIALVGPAGGSPAPSAGSAASPSPAPSASASPAPSGEPAETVPVDLPLAGRVDAAGLSPAVLALVLGGLDAFNPCALSVLLFLMSLLVGTRSRARMVLVGGIFVGVSGLVYFLLMAAWLNVFLVFGELRIITLAAGVAAVVAAAINIKDFAFFRRGVSLVMPDAAKPQVFGRMFSLVDATTLPALLGATILVAAVANTYEMLCTGGFPVVFTRVLTLNELPTLAYYGYLLLYNVIYVLPLLAVVMAFTVTLGSHTITTREARRLKLLSGLLMLGLGLLLLLAPERLTDMGATIGVFGTAVLVWAALVALETVTGRRRRGGGRVIAAG